MFIQRKNLTYHQRIGLDRQLGLLIGLTSSALVLLVITGLLPAGMIRRSIGMLLFLNGLVLGTGIAYRYWQLFKLERRRTKHVSC